jgi:hypothetical protein
VPTTAFSATALTMRWPTSFPAFARLALPVYVSAKRLTEMMTVRNVREVWVRAFLLIVATVFFVYAPASAQTDCGTGDEILDTAQPKGITPQEIIQKFTAAENKIKDIRSQYSYTQDVLVQTLDGKSVDGQFHQIAQISYDDKGKRLENITFSEVSTLRGVQISANDTDDIRVFMQWILTTDEAAQYNLTFAGQQHADDLDTYVFHVEPKQQEKNKRYFEGRVWVDNRDLEVVKLCGKSLPDIPAKKHQAADVRPTFVGYRQYIDGNWFPAYARVDQTLQLGTDSVHLREIVKFTGYKRAVGAKSASAH